MNSGMVLNLIEAHLYGFQTGKDPPHTY